MRVVLTAAAVLAAAFLFLLLPLPERPRAMRAAAADAHVAVGAFHVHTSRSDGSGSREDVAAAAAAAGMQFVVLSDHGDGTRAPDPPQYRSGVLVIDGVELSTADGHYVAVGLPQAPYPLRGEARDVVEDVRRLGGFGVVAHPDSAKPSLRWQDWGADVDAIEWLNADAEWRDESALTLAHALARYPFRPVATVASILDRPETTFARWDMLTQRRPIVAVAGTDAHARTGLSDEDIDSYRHGWFVRIPSYATSFRTFALRVLLDAPLGGDPQSDASRVIASLRTGRVYTAIDGVASPASLVFSAVADGHVASQGESLETNGPVSLRVTTAEGDGTLVLRRDGVVVSQAPMPTLDFESRGWGTYRAEVSVPTSPGTPPVPWIVSNPIYVRPAGWGRRSEAAYPPAAEGFTIQGGPWSVETDASSVAKVTSAGPVEGSVGFAYTLGGGERRGQYAALVIGVGTGLANRTRLSFRASAARPMRLSAQARRPRSGQRWQRSIYLDATPREIIVPFTELRSIGTPVGEFDPGLADTVLFVVDTTNTPPGASGTFTIRELRLER